MARENKRIIEGLVVSDKMMKTRVLLVLRTVEHPLYKRLIKKTKKFSYHDPLEQSKAGDSVRIIESKKYSKTKCWRLLEIKKSAAAVKQA